MQKKKTVIQFLYFLLPIYLLIYHSCGVKQTERPNVIVIITDDQGYGDLGATGNPVIKTPNLDQMARESVQMTDFYVSPVCAPTRACLMTGRYNYRTRCIDTYIGRAMMESEETTIAELLKTSGYATAIFGKWHLGDNYPMRPQDQGFDEVLVHRGGGIGQPSDPPGGEGKYTDPILFHNGQTVQKQGYCTDIYFEEAFKWMEQKHREQKKFFLYLATNAPHGPFHDVPKKLYEAYKKIDLNNDRFPQHRGHPLPESSDNDVRARIYAMITNIDENVGKLFKKMDQLDITNNTMVLFMVDNGPNRRRYVSGMRGMKSEVYEGGIRSPLFVHWPTALPKNHRDDHIVAHIDILPTILEACQVQISDNLQIDGRSFLSLLKNDPVDWPDRSIVIQAHRGDQPVRYHNFALRTSQWKLLHASGFGKENFTGKPAFELYDMSNDPLETENLASENQEKVNELTQTYDRWFEDVNHTRKDNYAPPRIHIGTPHENPVVLTRQDWRHTKGRPWAEDSNGHWLLYIAHAGTYTVKLSYHAEPLTGEAALAIGSASLKQPVSGNQTESLFKNIQLQPGNATLQAVLQFDNYSKGPWQVEILKEE